MLHGEHPYSSEQRVELLFARPGSTMLDTLIGLLLASSLRDPQDRNEARSSAAASAAAATAAPSVLEAFLVPEAHSTSPPAAACS